MKEIKLVSVDLDGTLLRSDKTISEKCFKSLHDLKKDGKIIVFNTARPLKLIPKKLLMWKDNYLILSNGAYCIYNGEKIFDHYIPFDDSRKIIKYFSLKYKDIFFSIESENEIYSCFENDYLCKLFFAEKVSKGDMMKKNIRKFLIINSENKYIDIEELKANIPKNTKILITEQGKYIQVMPAKSSKLAGMKFICRKLNTNLNEVLAFGDDLNDLDIIRKVRIGVAMNNAVPEIKNVATHITSSNDNNGIHHFINSNKFSSI